MENRNSSKKRIRYPNTPYPNTDGLDSPTAETPVSLDTQMYDIFGTPAVSTSSEMPMSPTTPALCTSSPSPTTPIPAAEREPTEEEMEAALRSLQPMGAITPLNRVPESWGSKSLYWHGVLIGLVVGSKIAWENKALFPVYRYSNYI